MKTNPLARYVVRKRTFFSLIIPIILVIFANPWSVGIMVGTAFLILGELIRIWAAGCIAKNVQLACMGPFAYVRNPLYLGSLFLGVGYCALSGLWWSWIVMAVFYYVFYVGTIFSEEEHLTTVLGEAYVAYKDSVPRLIPRLTPYMDQTGSRFSWSQVWYNREQWSIIGVVAFMMAFLLRRALS